MSKNPFKGQILKSPDHSAHEEKVKQWGAVKFKPRAPPKQSYQKPESATPWATFKSEIIEKQREERRTGVLNMDSEEAKKALREREKNYRRMVMMEKRNQPTHWEDFKDASEPGNVAVPKTSTQHETRNKTYQHKKTSKKKRIFDKSDLKNLGSKQLTFEQNDFMRRIITKNTIRVRGQNLEQMVEALKREKNLKEKRKMKEKTVPQAPPKKRQKRKVHKY